MSVHSSTQETATAEAKTKATSRGGASRRASTHLASGVIGKAEGAVVVRSKRLSADAFLNLTRLPTVVLVDITLKRSPPLLFHSAHAHTRHAHRLRHALCSNCGPLSTSPYRKFAYAYPVGGIPLPLGRKEAVRLHAISRSQ